MQHRKVHRVIERFFGETVVVRAVTFTNGDYVVQSIEFDCLGKPQWRDLDEKDPLRKRFFALADKEIP